MEDYSQQCIVDTVGWGEVPNPNFFADFIHARVPNTLAFSLDDKPVGGDVHLFSAGLEELL
jgi:hypothetical protein